MIVNEEEPTDTIWYSALNVEAYVPVAPENVTYVPTVRLVVDAVTVTVVVPLAVNEFPARPESLFPLFLIEKVKAFLL